MITPLTIATILFKTFLLIIMSVGILAFGKLIAGTEDKLDRIGKRKEKTDAPARHARYFVIGFWTIFLVGSVILILSTTTKIEVIGWVTTFSAALFAGTVLLYEIKIYNLMKANQRELKGSWVA
jgi:hypothetical protein